MWIFSQSAERIEMGFISRQIDKMYSGVLFRRHDPDGSIFYFSHSDFPGIIKEDFSFESKRGHLLKGCFYRYGNARMDRLVVFEHGMGNGHTAYFREIEILLRAGYLVYSYDHTGCNDSEGEHIYGLSGSLSDLDDCIRALVRERGFSESQISVVGHSWGGFSTLNILSLHKELRSIVAVSGFISIPIMQKQTLPFVCYPFLSNLYELEKNANPDFVKSSAIDTLSSTDRPALIIHSVDDKTVSYKRNFLAMKSALEDKENISFLTARGSGHNPFYSKDAFEYKEAFFSDLKKKRKQGRLKTAEQKAAFVNSYDWYRMTEQNKEIWNHILDFINKH